MVYSYLLNLYTLLESHRLESSAVMGNPDFSENESAYAQGRLDVIEEMTSFLEQRYDQKLPRRLQKKKEN